MGASYPFPELTRKTYGIRTGETVLVTAQEKVGKTEFMHAILHSLLKEQKDANIAGLFHEENADRVLRAVAGIELGRPVHLPDCGVAEDTISATVDQIVGRDDRLYLHSFSGDTDPKSILDTIRFLAAGCNCKYVIWDHPGMVVFGVGDDKERQTLDYLAAGGEALVKELNFALIVVYHVNDMGQIRGSRYPGKTCDVRIDLSRDTGNEDPAIRNSLNVTIPYIRFGSNSGPVGVYTFNPDTQRYTETVANDSQYGALAAA
jgi:twinkle protein